MTAQRSPHKGRVYIEELADDLILDLTGRGLSHVEAVRLVRNDLAAVAGKLIGRTARNSIDLNDRLVEHGALVDDAANRAYGEAIKVRVESVGRQVVEALTYIARRARAGKP